MMLRSVVMKTERGVSYVAKDLGLVGILNKGFGTINISSTEHFLSVLCSAVFCWRLILSKITEAITEFFWREV